MEVKRNGTVAGRISTLDDLRGVAALGVCLFHTSTLQHKIPDSFALGVYIFFVISGFILPYTMHRQGYRIRHYGVFMLKRLARLYPPFLVSIVLFLTAAFISSRLPGFRSTFELEWLRLFGNLTYLAEFLKTEWYLRIYWTLGVEFQFYLLIGLSYLVLTNEQPLVRVGGWALLIALSFVPGSAWLFHFLPVFLLGFWAYCRRSRGWAGAASWAVFAGLVLLCALTQEWRIALVSAGAALAVVYATFSWRPLRYLGVISYSLYLVHPICFHYAQRLRDHFAPRLHDHYLQPLELITAILIAWILFRLIEVPSLLWANRIRYSPREPR